MPATRRSTRGPSLVAAPPLASLVAALAALLLAAGLLAAVPAYGDRLATTDVTAGASADVPATEEVSAAQRAPRLKVRRLVGGLDVPWDVQPIGAGRFLVTERDRRRLSLVHRGKRRTVKFPRRTVWASGETGLMSLAVAPDFARSRRFYVCHGGFTRRGNDVRVVSYRLSKDGRKARGRTVLLTGLPATSGRHGGCRLLSHPSSGALFVGTGDAAVGTHPRDLRSLGGKVLRLDPATGKPWPDNPFIDSPHRRKRYVYTFGHRNVQGLAAGPDTTVWAVEHGSDRDDEVNILTPGGDYGWHPVPGYNESVPMTDHALPGQQMSARWSSGAPTVAASGAAWVPNRGWGRWGGTLAVATLKASRLLFMRFEPNAFALEWVRAPRTLRRHGRLRSVTVAPNGNLLVTTSNGGGKDAVLVVTPRR